jgi:KRAB domain-containing zinc finger protein
MMCIKIEGQMYIAEKEREYTCEICSKEFRRYDHLKRHVLIHTGENKKYACPVCSKDFGRKSHLDRHIKTTKKGSSI